MISCLKALRSLQLPSSFPVAAQQQILSPPPDFPANGAGTSALSLGMRSNKAHLHWHAVGAVLLGELQLPQKFPVIMILNFARNTDTDLTDHLHRHSVDGALPGGQQLPEGALLLVASWQLPAILLAPLRDCLHQKDGCMHTRCITRDLSSEGPSWWHLPCELVSLRADCQDLRSQLPLQRNAAATCHLPPFWWRQRVRHCQMNAPHPPNWSLQACYPLPPDGAAQHAAHEPATAILATLQP